MLCGYPCVEGLKEDEFRADDNLHARLQQFKQEELQLYNKQIIHNTKHMYKTK